MLTPSKTEPLPVALARSGNPNAWDALYRRYQLPIYAYVFELVRQEQVALDIVQEAFISAVRHLADLQDDPKFGSWLFGIAHQKCLQHWRRNERDRALSEEMAESSTDFADPPDEVLIREEQKAELMNFLKQLPLPQRSALLLHFLEGFSLEEIAVITGAQLGTVKSRIHYGKRALKQLLTNSQ